jgi:hypothetical protein
MRAGDPVRLLQTYAGVTAGSHGIVCDEDPERQGALLVVFENGVTSVSRGLLADSSPAPSTALAEAIRVIGLTTGSRGTDLWSFLAWIDRVIARRHAELENGGTEPS